MLAKRTIIAFTNYHRSMKVTKFFVNNLFPQKFNVENSFHSLWAEERMPDELKIRSWSVFLNIVDIKKPYANFQSTSFQRSFQSCSGEILFSLHAALLFTSNIQKDIISNRSFNHQRSHRIKKKHKEIENKTILKRTTLLIKKEKRKKKHFLSAHIAANKCRIMIESDPSKNRVTHRDLANGKRLIHWKKRDTRLTMRIDEGQRL